MYSRLSNSQESGAGPRFQAVWKTAMDILPETSYDSPRLWKYSLFYLKKKGRKLKVCFCANNWEKLEDEYFELNKGNTRIVDILLMCYYTITEKKLESICVLDPRQKKKKKRQDLLTLTTLRKTYTSFDWDLFSSLFICSENLLSIPHS